MLYKKNINIRDETNQSEVSSEKNGKYKFRYNWLNKMNNRNGLNERQKVVENEGYLLEIPEQQIDNKENKKMTLASNSSDVSTGMLY